MEYIAAPTGTVGRILCCECGIPIEPNPTNTCVTCLRQQSDITVGIPRFKILSTYSNLVSSDQCPEKKIKKKSTE